MSVRCHTIRAHCAARRRSYSQRHLPLPLKALVAWLHGVAIRSNDAEPETVSILPHLFGVILHIRTYTMHPVHRRSLRGRSVSVALAAGGGRWKLSPISFTSCSVSRSAVNEFFSFVKLERKINLSQRHRSQSGDEFGRLQRRKEGPRLSVAEMKPVIYRLEASVMMHTPCTS